MADIFISYSSKDKEKADQLTELLASAGLSVWMDQSGIDVATSWSGEIVDAIEGCKAFVVLLSPNSIGSRNVVKEVALAAEKGKKILPLDLEPVALTRDLQYHLAGIQRAPMTNIDAVIRALGKIGLEATQAPSIKLIKESDERKSLMILPFEDLSPTADNQWFADGLAAELISALSNIKALRVTDQQTTKEFKKYTGHLTTYAKEMSIRYFIQGSVRKFGDQIKITSSLLDIETSDHLWQDSMRGKMEDIFNIQEAVASKVAEGLKLHLTSEEKKKLAERGTENAEAYELYLKCLEYFKRNTKEGFQLTAQLCSEAVALDPAFAEAYTQKATALCALFDRYERDPKLLDEGLTLVQEALRLKPGIWNAQYPLAIILVHQGKFAEAEQVAEAFVRDAPENASSHFSLGFIYGLMGQPAKAIPSLEEGLRLQPDNLPGLVNIVYACNDARLFEKRKQRAEFVLPKLLKYVKLYPEEESYKVSVAQFLFFADRIDEAHEAIQRLDHLRDGNSLYSVATLQCNLGEYVAGLANFHKAIVTGFRDPRALRGLLEAENGLGSLKGTPEWEEIHELVENTLTQTKSNG